MKKGKLEELEKTMKPRYKKYQKKKTNKKVKLLRA